MLGKTHMMVGIAATVAITKPATVSEMILAAGGGALGALISDIDVGTSGSHKEADKIVALSTLVVGGVIACDYFFHTHMIARILRNSGYARTIAGILLFIGICAFGKEQPHRSFMHSFLALLMLDVALGIMWERAVPYFTIGFLSHLATDIFNKKQVRLLYPMKRGIALGWFHAHGIANRLFFLAGCAVTAVELAKFWLAMMR